MLWCVYFYLNLNLKLVIVWIFIKMKLILKKNKWDNFLIRRIVLFFVKNVLYYIFIFCCFKDVKSVFNN